VVNCSNILSLAPAVTVPLTTLETVLCAYASTAA